MTRSYLIPATNAVPDDDYCVQVYIPRNTDYLINFFTALSHFGKWVAWKENGDNNAKAVADRWKQSIELTHEKWAEGECMSFLLRQNPTNPCQLQQSVDGGTTWTLAFDYTLCETTITVAAPYTGSETGQADASGAIINNFWKALPTMAAVYCGGSREDYITAATAYMRTFDPSYANPSALGAVYDAYCAATTEEQDAAVTDCPYQQKFEEQSACINSDGLIDWLNCFSDQIAAWLNETNDAIIEALNQAAASLSGNGWQTMTYGNAGGGAGFGGGCINEYVVTYDTGSTPYTLVHGTEIAGGNPNDCAQSVGWYGFGNWQGSSVTRIDLASGTLDALTIDDQVYSLPTGTIVGVQLDHYDNTDTLLNTTSTSHDYAVAVGSWYTFAALTGLGWEISAGDYILIYVGITTTSEANANSTDVRVDNLTISGELLQLG